MQRPPPPNFGKEDSLGCGPCTRTSIRWNSEQSATYKIIFYLSRLFKMLTWECEKVRYRLCNLTHSDVVENHKVVIFLPLQLKVSFAENFLC